MRRLACILFVATLASGQDSDIFERLRRSLGQQASAALAKQDFAQIQQMLAKVPANQETLALRGAVAFLDGRMPDCVANLEKAAPLRDSDNFTLAMALIRLGDGKRARAILNELSGKHPASAIYIYWLGRLDYDQRRYEEAVGRLQRASDLDPNSARIQDSLGLALDMQGRTEQAQSVLEKAAKLNRSQEKPSPWPPHDLGYLLLRMERFKEAEELLRESLRYGPGLAQTHYYLGRTLEKEGRDADAVEEYKQAISADTASTDVCYSLAILYRKLHRESEAEAMFAEYRKRKAAVVPAQP
jgi:tetratricopeptide (TPR) repeat protein